MGNKYVIVLTACINPGKMIHTSLTDVDIRRRQYKDALEFYLLQTDYPIVFVENSGTDISGDFREMRSLTGRKEKDMGRRSSWSMH